MGAPHTSKTTRVVRSRLNGERPWKTLCDDRLSDGSQLIVEANSPELSFVARQDDWRTAEGLVHKRYLSVE
jgi:hypothetical protein